MEKNKFNFSKLTALFTDYPALKIDETSYSYQQINDLIQRKLTDYSHSSKTVITLINDSPLNFIIDFLAIIESGNYPLVVDKSFKKKSFEFGLIPEDTLFLASTSGTTGQPKIYYRNWESWKMGFEVCDDLFHLSKSQALATTSPLTTSLGLHTLMCALYLGKTFLAITNPSQFINIKESYVLFTVPTYLLNNLNELFALTSPEIIFLGGGTLSPEAINKVRKKLPQTQMIEFYGSSETSFISWQVVNDGKKTSSVGKLFPHVELTLGPKYRLTVKSPYLFSGYLNQPYPQSWTTDDLGTLKNNHLYLFGRRSDIIEHGANKIFPEEIERMAKDLCEDCIAFGVFDERYSQKIALLLLKPIEKEKLIKILAQRLPKYKLPQIYLETPTLNFTKNQKISRKELEKEYFRGVYHEL